MSMLRPLFEVSALRSLAFCSVAGLFCVMGCSRADAPPVNLDVVSSPGESTTAQSRPAEDNELKRKLDEVLDFTYQHRRLNLKDHAAWQIIHGSLAFGRDYKIVDRDGNFVSAVDYLLNGGEMNGWKMQPGDLLGNPPHPALKAILEQGSKTGQGHPDQWLGYLSGCDLPLSQSIKLDGKTYTLEDLLLQAEHDVPYNPEREYSWTLMGMTVYRPTNYEWTAGDGNRWNIGKLLEIELEHDLADSACGGTHRMAGITMALNRHLAAGGKLEGPWLAASEKINKCIETAREYQNPDGSLSSNYFNRPGNSPDLAQTIGSSGHALEFVVLASTDEQLREPWVRRAVEALCDLLLKTKKIDLECGALYHATHGLVLYRNRIYGERKFTSPGDVAANSADAAPGQNETAAQTP